MTTKNNKWQVDNDGDLIWHKVYVSEKSAMRQAEKIEAETEIYDFYNEQTKKRNYVIVRVDRNKKIEINVFKAWSEKTKKLQLLKTIFNNEYVNKIRKLSHSQLINRIDIRDYNHTNVVLKNGLVLGKMDVEDITEDFKHILKKQVNK